ncbi:MAG: helix-turn-helix domain-containing protein [Gemmatimonadales bacterium]
MKKAKQTRLAAHGWRVGSTADFLELTPEEAALIETKLALSRSLRALRTKRQITQTALARRLKSSQSRVAKLEAGDPSVSVDLLLRALFALGAGPRDIAKTLQGHGGAAA